VQTQNASRMPSGGISETSGNAVLASVEAAEPRNEIEAVLAVQAGCTDAVNNGGVEHGRLRLRRTPERSPDGIRRCAAMKSFYGSSRDDAPHISRRYASVP
jgi:hypothetical protein